MESLYRSAARIGFEEDNTLAEAFWNYASAGNWISGMKGQNGLPFARRKFAWPIFDGTAPGTPEVAVWRSLNYWDEPARWTGQPPAHHYAVSMVPWNGWPTGEGSDQGIIIRDVDGTWTILNLRRVKAVERIVMNTRLWWEAPWWSKGQVTYVGTNDMVCDGMTLNTPANRGKIDGCGSGKIPKDLGILTADMAANGVKEALSLVVVNSRMGEKSKFRFPGTRVEHLTKASRGKAPVVPYLPMGDDDRMLPCGTRLVLYRPLSEIEEWAKGLPPEKRRAAMNIAIGLMIFGMVTKETGDGQTGLECEGDLNDQQRIKWNMLGLVTDHDFAHLLDGLIRGPFDLCVVKVPN